MSTILGLDLVKFKGLGKLTRQARSMCLGSRET
jgi:hypothetical protein